MPADKVEIVRAIYDRWSEGDFRTIEVLDPLVLLVIGEGFPEAGTYPGLERVAEYMRGFLEPWTRVTIEAEEIIEAGDTVLVRVYQSAIGEGSGISTDLRYFFLWTFRGSTVIRMETFRERADALQAAGLPPID